MGGAADKVAGHDVGRNPRCGSPFALSFGNNTLHPPIDGGLQDCVPTVALLRNEGTVEQNGELLYLEFLFSGGGDGGSV